MRPDLPWNVAGIPPEAREAARAAARREGLSVGEWLTRRILRSFSDAGDETATDRWSGSSMYRAEEHSPSTRRDTDEMLDHVNRSEAATNDVYRRIEEQLRGVARRLDATERSQSENNRALSKAATEINIATREQSQSFDQLGAHVVGLADRIQRIERDSNASGMKDAVKGLHTGLSRLADQIAQTANQSAAQISSLANNLEAVSGRLGQARQDAESTSRALDQRITAVEARQVSRPDSDAEQQRRDALTAGAIARLEENLGRLEARGPDPALDRRLTGIERTLIDIAARLDSIDPAAARHLEESVRKLASRIDAAENQQHEQISELRAAMNDAPGRISGFGAAPPPITHGAGNGFAQPSVFDVPPFPDMAPDPGHGMGAQHLPFQAQADSFAAAAYDNAGFGVDPFAPAQAAPVDSYLSAARRSARAAADQAQAERGASGFSWGASPAAPKAPGRTRYLLIGIIALICVAALVAGVVLSQDFLGRTTHSAGVDALFPNKAQTPPVGQPVKPENILPSSDNPLNDETPSGTAPPPSASGSPLIRSTGNKAAVLPLQQQTVRSAPVHTVPIAAQPSALQNTAPIQTAPPPQQQSVVPALDRLTALANGGNAKAELIVGLKYLDGDGVAINEAQAAKWLERAAESGEPVAQYRLGTLYERGKGVAADPAKATHWYQAAAMQGNRKAMHNLAVAFAEGTGTKKDMAEAARWFSKAAALGLADSQFNLAVLYERGLGVPQSLLDAFKWYSIAAAQGDNESKTRIDALSTQLGSDDRAAAQHAAETFKPQPLDARANVPPQMADLHG